MKCKKHYPLIWHSNDSMSSIASAPEVAVSHVPDWEALIEEQPFAYPGSFPNFVLSHWAAFPSQHWGSCSQLKFTFVLWAVQQLLVSANISPSALAILSFFTFSIILLLSFFMCLVTAALYVIMYLGSSSINKVTLWIPRPAHTDGQQLILPTGAHTLSPVKV